MMTKSLGIYMYYNKMYMYSYAVYSLKVLLQSIEGKEIWQIDDDVHVHYIYFLLFIVGGVLPILAH